MSPFIHATADRLAAELELLARACHRIGNLEAAAIINDLADVLVDATKEPAHV